MRAPAGPHRRAPRHRARLGRDPLVVDPGARRQDRRDPGHGERDVVRPKRTGVFEGQCAELCGLYHAKMPRPVEVMPAAEFDAWLAERREQQEAGTSPLGEETWEGLREVPRARRRRRLRAAARRHGARRGPERDRAAPPRRPRRDAAGRARLDDDADRRAERLPGAEPWRLSVAASRRATVVRRPGSAAASRAGSSPSTTSGSGSSTSRRPASSSCSPGFLALLIRTQLATADSGVVTGDAYNEVVTMHGTAMVFFVVVPILAGLGNFLVPLMIGAPDMAFPRLNALSYWLFAFAGTRLLLLVLRRGRRGQHGLDGLPAAVRDRARERPGPVDPLAPHPHALVAGRARSTSSSRSTTCAPAACRGCGCRSSSGRSRSTRRCCCSCCRRSRRASRCCCSSASSRARSTSSARGRRHAVLYQHVFWFFGHPEVYIMILPAMGIISEILPVFARKPIFGYKAIAFSTVAIGFFSLLVWAHHMFTVGLATYLNVWFMLASMVIAVPTGMKIFNWLATLWRGNISLDTPMLFALGFLSRLHDRRPVGDLPGRVPDRLAGARHVLRRRALPLRALRRLDLRDHRRALLLVAEDVRPVARPSGSGSGRSCSSSSAST